VNALFALCSPGCIASDDICPDNNRHSVSTEWPVFAGRKISQPRAVAKVCCETLFEALSAAWPGTSPTNVCGQRCVKETGQQRVRVFRLRHQNRSDAGERGFRTPCPARVREGTEVTPSGAGRRLSEIRLPGNGRVDPAHPSRTGPTF